MPENKKPPSDDQPPKPEEQEEKISRVGEEIECQHPDCKRTALSLSSYCWEHIKDKESYQKRIEDWSRARNSMEKFILTNADLSYLDIKGVKLSGARLGGANLLGAVLEGSNLSGAGLWEANLFEATLKEVNLSGANLFLANLSEAWLEGANLSWADLRRANLSEAYLEGANLSRAKLLRANLSGAWLEGANLSGAGLQEANLTEAGLPKANLSGAWLEGANLSGAELWFANLSGAELWRAKFTNAFLNQAMLTGAKGLTRQNFSEKLTEEEKEKAGAYIESYITVKNYFTQNGLYDDASWAAFRERTLERIAWYNQLKGEVIIGLRSWEWLKTAFRWFGSKAMSLLNGYGERPFRVVISSMVIVIGFSILYFFKDYIIANPPDVLHWWDYLYFSIVTFTTLGYGDIRPMAVPWARLVASGEAFIGAFMIALFVWTLARKYVAR